MVHSKGESQEHVQDNAYSRGLAIIVWDNMYVNL